MKRLQIMIEEDLDADIGRQAAERGVSKAALIRETMRDRVRPLPPLEEDPLWDWVGKGDFESGRHDDVVYPREGPV
ncbi:MAG: CopG family transcriptional regulator [Thermoleophilaceae bacterium]